MARIDPCRGRCRCLPSSCPSSPVTRFFGEESAMRDPRMSGRTIGEPPFREWQIVVRDLFQRLVFVTNPKAPEPTKSPWHAVSISGGSAACRAVKALGNQRFLSAEAPALPLPQCSSASTCKCIYRHWSDRRAILRRETDRGRFPRPRFGQERRQAPRMYGRRADDESS